MTVTKMHTSKRRKTKRTTAKRRKTKRTTAKRRKTKRTTTKRRKTKMTDTLRKTKRRKTKRTTTKRRKTKRTTTKNLKKTLKGSLKGGANLPQPTHGTNAIILNKLYNLEVKNYTDSSAKKCSVGDTTDVVIKFVLSSNVYSIHSKFGDNDFTYCGLVNTQNSTIATAYNTSECFLINTTYKFSRNAGSDDIITFTNTNPLYLLPGSRTSAIVLNKKYILLDPKSDNDCRDAKDGYSAYMKFTEHYGNHYAIIEDENYGAVDTKTSTITINHETSNIPCLTKGTTYTFSRPPKFPMRIKFEETSPPAAVAAAPPAAAVVANPEEESFGFGAEEGQLNKQFKVANAAAKTN